MSSGQQFVDDYMIVIENDLYAWQHHKTIAKQENNDVFGVADRLRDEFESSVNDLLNKLDPSHANYRVNLMREMLLGWGTYPYENIARELLSRLEEGK